MNKKRSEKKIWQENKSKEKNYYNSKKDKHKSKKEDRSKEFLSYSNKTK